MASDKAFADDVTARLTPIGPVVWRRMFGGFGIYLEGVMFALIAYDRLHFKVDDRNRPDYEAAGSEPFTYEGKTKPVRMSYWRVPESVLDDGEALCHWARAAHGAALRSKAAKPPKKSRRQS